MELKKQPLPKISVVTCSYNQGDFIDDCIQSVLKQNYPNFEHIVLDGASTDGTVEKLKQYKHLIWESEKDNGQSDALNKGFKMASGDIVAWINSDDWYPGGALKKVGEYFRDHPETKILIGDCFFYNEGASEENIIVHNSTFEFDDIIRYWDGWIPPTQPAIFFRRELFEEVGYLDESLHFAMDYDLWLRISQKYDIAYIPELLAGYRFHNLSKSGDVGEWNQFYPEWNKVYQRYRFNSEQFSKVSPIVSVIITAQITDAITESGVNTRLRQLIDDITGQIVQDLELIILTNQADQIKVRSENGTIQIRVFQLDSFDEESIQRAIDTEAKGGIIERLHPDQKWIEPEHYVSLISKYIPGKTTSGAKDVSVSRFDAASDTDALPVSAYYTEDVVFSVIIPTYNRSKTLKKCLDALSRQTFSVDHFEVIVCDDGSTDDTVELIRGYEASYNLIYTSQENAGPAKARNKGLKKAQGKYVLFINDDTILDESALAKHYETHFAHPGEKISVLGTFEFPEEYRENLLVQLIDEYDLLFEYNKMQPGGYHDYNFFYTCNLSVSRQAMLDVGMFDEAFDGPAAEDIDLGFRLGKNGYRLIYQPACISIHDHPVSLEGFCRTHLLRGYGHMTLVTRHPELNYWKDSKPEEILKWADYWKEQSPMIEKLLYQLKETGVFSKSEAKGIKREELAEILKLLMNYYSALGKMDHPFLKQFLNPGNEPVVSVIIPCYNYGKYLRECVESVLQQTYSSIEIIIVNDGSKDNSKKVAEQLISDYPEDDIILINQKNAGQPAISRNNGIKKAKGQYILPLDADDKLAPTFIEKTLKKLQTNPEHAIAYTHRQDFDGANDVHQAQPFNLNKLRYQNHLSYCALYKKDVWEEIGGYRTNVRGIEDWDFFVAAGAAGFKAVLIPEPLFLYRRHDTGVFQDVLKDFESSYANLVLNNTSLYSDAEVADAEAVVSPEKKVKAQKASPKVSVIVPTHNRPDGLREAIQSIQNQSFQDFEIIVVNDAGSNVKEVVESLDDKRIRYFSHKKNKGLAAARNTGLKKAKGRYIAYLDDDDIYYFNHLETLINQLEYSGYKVAYTDAYRAHQKFEKGSYYIAGRDKPFSKNFDASAILVRNYFPVLAIMHERSCLERSGTFDETLTSHEDWDLWIRLSRFYTFVHIPKVTCEYRWREDGSSMSSSMKKDFLRTMKMIYEKYEEYLTDQPALKEAQQKSLAELEREINRLDQHKVTIVIPVYNRRDLTEQCLKSIKNHTPDGAYEVIVVDNASGEDTYHYLQSCKKDGLIRFIRNEQNEGFARACNQGIEAAKYPNVLLLNNDIVVTDNWLQPMVSELEHDPQTGIVGNCLLYPDSDIIQHAGVTLGWYKGELHPYHKYRLRSLKEIPEAAQSCYVQAVTGACMLIRKSVIDAVGALDETYKNSYEDVDLCMRIIQAGFRIRYCAQSSIYHHESMSKGRHDNDSRNFKIFQKRWADVIQTGEKEAESRINLHDIWAREALIQHPDNKEAMKVLLQLAKQRGDQKEVARWSEKLGIKATLSVTPDGTLVSIIIPVFNKWDLTNQCLNYLRKNTPQKYEIIVVDNASTDGTRERLLQLQREGIVKAIINGTNEGFAKACNKGARAASGSYLLFLNNDTVVHPGWLEAMLKEFEQVEQTGIVGSRLLYPDFTIQHAGIAFTEQGLPYHIHRGVQWNDPKVNQSKIVPAVTGACMMIPVTVFNRVSGFDESYQMYVEDIDLCLRVWEAGYKVVYSPESMVTHLESASVQDTDKRDGQVRAAWAKMHERWLGRWPEQVLSMLPESLCVQKRNGNRGVKSDQSNKPVYWTAPLFNQSGYADEARHFLIGLADNGVPVQGRHIGDASESFIRQLDIPTRDKLAGLISTDVTLNGISIVHAPGYALQRLPGADYHIGRTMFETDRLPDNWVETCNRMDEIWVPSEFNRETFEKAGVSVPIQIIPEGIDARRYHPGIPPLPIPGARGTVFLAVFEWIYRKGWDVLLEAWTKAFSADDDVSLVLRTYPMAQGNGDATKKINHMIDEYLIKSATSREDVAPIIVLGEQIPEKQMPRLYASAHVLVAPSRGEGWGRPHMAGMATGLPVIATGWSGNTSFMNEKNSLLIPSSLVAVDERCEIPFYRGHQWAEPSVEKLSEHMKACAESESLRKGIGAQARRDIEEKWDWSKVVAIAKKRLEELRSHRVIYSPVGNQMKPSIVWEGSQFVTHSLAHVNRSIGKQLLKKGFNLSLIPFEKDTFIPEKGTKDYELYQRYGASVLTSNKVHVRHHWPPNFTPPASGHWVMIQPWEFGSLPEKWIRPMSTQLDEIWVPSSYVKECYVRSGVPKDRVQVVPNGVDVDTFSPSAKPYPLKTKKSFKFLFVGGTIGRKGIDVLLDAYIRNFKASDDVCLVIKDMGGKSFYQGQTAAESIAQLQAHPDAPEIEYIDQELTNDEMAGLYTASDCLVHPYRGEGFGLPIAEAMSAGLPVIVTNHGAALDFCTQDNAWLVDAKEVKLIEKTIGNIPTVDYPWWANPDSDSLIKCMRDILKNPEETKRKAVKARETILASFTWEHVGNVVADRILEISKRPVRRMKSVSEINWDSKEAFIQYFMQGVQKQKWSDLEKETLKACQQYSSDSYIWVLRAICLRMISRYDDAIEAVKHSLKIEETPEALHEAIQIARVNGEEAQADALTDHLNSRFPEWAQNLQNQPV